MFFIRFCHAYFRDVLIIGAMLIYGKIRYSNYKLVYPWRLLDEKAYNSFSYVFPMSFLMNFTTYHQPSFCVIVKPYIQYNVGFFKPISPLEKSKVDCIRRHVEWRCMVSCILMSVWYQKKDWLAPFYPFLSPPVRMHGRLICVAFCMSVTRPKFISQELLHLGPSTLVIGQRSRSPGQKTCF